MGTGESEILIQRFNQIYTTPYSIKYPYTAYRVIMVRLNISFPYFDFEQIQRGCRVTTIPRIIKLFNNLAPYYQGLFIIFSLHSPMTITPILSTYFVRFSQTTFFPNISCTRVLGRRLLIYYAAYNLWRVRPVFYSTESSATSLYNIM